MTRRERFTATARSSMSGLSKLELLVTRADRFGKIWTRATLRGRDG